jgi:glycosyltransferase involved in cell wall biosynthesis
VAHQRTVGAKKHKIVLLGPSLEAVSGVSTHLRMLFASDLVLDYELLHFQVGSEGRRETALQRLMRFSFSPLHLALILMRTGAEVVHLNASLDPKAYWRDLVYSIVARLLRRRVVNQIHGGAMPQDFFRNNALLTWVLRRFLVSSDVVTVLSSAELTAYRKFDPRIRVHLVPNAIDTSGLAGRRCCNTVRPLKLIYVGRLARTKGLFEVIEAMTELKRVGRKFRLCIAGEGPDQAALMAAAQQAGLEDRIEFPGGVFGAEKWRLWFASDVFVFPTYHKEGLPYSLLEAMAAGCVPVTTSVAAIPDVMRDQEHGLFVPPKDASALALAVATLDDDRPDLFRMAESARRRALEHYTVTRLADDFRKLYQGCLERGVGSST